MKILFVDKTKGFTPTRIDEKPTGGILTSYTLIPRYLAKLGHSVEVISDYDKDCVHEGVHYTPGPMEKNIWDIVVFNRNMINRPTAEFFENSRKIWWLHDIPDHRYLQDDAFKLMDTIVALSQYNRDSFSDFYGIPKEKFVIIPNGVDKSVFYPGTAPRNRELYVMGSAPIKGVFPIPFMFTNMRRISDKFELRAYMGDKLHELALEDGDAKKLENLKNLGVNVLDPIPQKGLADVLRSAWALVMSNHYPENCSNLMLQAMACGCPVITTPIGNAPEIIKSGENGILTTTYPHDWYWHWKVFAEAAAGLYFDKKLHKKLSDNASMSVKSWDEIGKMWSGII